MPRIQFVSKKMLRESQLLFIASGNLFRKFSCVEKMLRESQVLFVMIMVIRSNSNSTVVIIVSGNLRREFSLRRGDYYGCIFAQENTRVFSAKAKKISFDDFQKKLLIWSFFNLTRGLLFLLGCVRLQPDLRSCAWVLLGFFGSLPPLQAIRSYELWLYQLHKHYYQHSYCYPPRQHEQGILVMFLGRYEAGWGKIHSKRPVGARNFCPSKSRLQK